MNISDKILVESFLDEETGTFSYLLLDRTTQKCALIDSVLNYDASSGRTLTHGADLLAGRVEELGAQVQWILETHVHADHLSAASYLQDKLGGLIGIVNEPHERQDTVSPLR